MPLTDTTIKNAQPGAKSTPCPDDDSPYLMITPSGSKLWLMRLWHEGCSETSPLISLKEAGPLRDRHLERARYADLPAQTGSIDAKPVAGD